MCVWDDLITFVMILLALFSRFYGRLECVSLTSPIHFTTIIFEI